MHINDEKVEKIICFLDGNEKTDITTHETKPSETLLRVGLDHPNIGKISKFNVSKKEDARLEDKPVPKVKIGIIGLKSP